MNLAHDEKDAKGEMDRMEFEAHLDAENIPIVRDADGEYAWNDARQRWQAWQAWQAARADTARTVAEAARYRFLRDTPDADFRPFALRRGTSPADADATVDARMKVFVCDRCGDRVASLKRTTNETNYKGCDVCAECLNELEPGRARATPPDAGEPTC